MDTPPLGVLDLAIVLDTTGSMERVAEHAKRVMLGAPPGGDLRVGFVLYRDHPWEDSAYTTRVYPFTRREQSYMDSLRRIVYAGGGDTKEAALDGLVAAVNLRWRKSAGRRCWLITDAPFHDPCPCGLTGGGVVELLAVRGIRLDVFLFAPPVPPALSLAFSADAHAHLLREAISIYGRMSAATGGVLTLLRDGVAQGGDAPGAATPEWIARF